MTDPVLVPAEELRAALSAGAQILDIRASGAYVREHIPDSINVPYSRGAFAQQAAYFLRPEVPVVLIADDRQLAALAAADLADAGFPLQGHLEGGLAAWKETGGETAAIGQMTADELAAKIAAGDAPRLVDVREGWEFASGHIDGAEHLPLSEFVQRYSSELDPNVPTVFVCASGARSGEAVQFLYRLGHRKVYNLVGGMGAWMAGGRRF